MARAWQVAGSPSQHALQQQAVVWSLGAKEERFIWSSGAIHLVSWDVELIVGPEQPSYTLRKSHS